MGVLKRKEGKMATGTNSIIVNVLAKKENDLWTGHCLEFDIVATADSIDQLKRDMIDLILAQIDYAFSNDNLGNLYHPAPARVWEEFYSCKNQTEEKVRLESHFQNDNLPKSFVPPWIIAKTCLLESQSFA